MLHEARATVHKWLGLPDLNIVDVILGTVIANANSGDPVWMIIVGPPSSAKSELLRALGGSPHTFRLSSLTSKTLISGHEEAGGGLLFRIPNKSTLVLLDFGQILSSAPAERTMVLQRLREVYDGYTKGDFGNRTDSLEWKGKLGFLAGGTPAIERFTSVGAELGDRYIHYGIEVADPGAQALEALDNSGNERVMREEISDIFAQTISESPPPDTITVTEEAKTVLASLAVMVSRLRTAVSRDRYSKDIDYIPQPEGPARLAKALLVLCKAISALRQKTEIGAEELKVIAQVALKSIPSKRTRFVEALMSVGEGHTKTINMAAGLPTSTVLEDLACLGAVERWTLGKTANSPVCWKLKEDLKAQLALAYTLTGKEIKVFKEDTLL